MPTLAVISAAAGVFYGIVPPETKEITLEFHNLPTSLDGYRIAQITDLHCSSASRGWRTKAVVERANKVGADLICLTGDYVDGTVSDRDEDMKPLTELSARDGVYYVTGNHEYIRNTDGWKEWFKKNKMRFLENECVFPRPGLALGGVNDFAVMRSGGIAPDVGRTFTCATNGEFRLLLQHRPENAVENIKKHGVDLQLSGHTHGGVTPILRNWVSKFNGGFSLGTYRLGDGILYVSPGSGQWAGFLSRFFNPSEITLITLRKAKSSAPEE